MSPARVLLSLCLAAHLLVTGLASLPWPARAGYRTVRDATQLYAGLWGVTQQWRMFSNPPRTHDYMRVRYYVGARDAAGARPGWMATELVFPAHREDRTRLGRSFRDSYTDKAIAKALESFYGRRPSRLIRPDLKPESLPDDLAPIARYYSGRFRRTSLRTDERILRTEVWAGTSPIPEFHDTARRTSPFRLATVRSYYDGPLVSRFRIPPYPPYHAVDTEGDVRWVLEYYEAT